MIDVLKEKVKTLASAGVSLVDGIAERQIGFATSTLNGSFDAARQLRGSRSLNDVVALQTSYLTDLQGQIVALGSANLAALKEFGTSAAEAFKQSGKEVKDDVKEAKTAVKKAVS